jgi:hypothetical protein
MDTNFNVLGLMRVVFTKRLPEMNWKGRHTIKMPMKIYMKARVEQDRQCMYKRKFEVRSCHYFWHRKGISIIYFECLSVAVVKKQVKLMRHIVFPSEVSLE